MGTDNEMAGRRANAPGPAWKELAPMQDQSKQARRPRGTGSLGIRAGGY